MRLGEVRQILDQALAGKKTIVLEHESLYGDQVRRIQNYDKVITVLDLLRNKEWGGINQSILDELKARYPSSPSADLLPDDFNRLNDIVNTVNQKLPLFCSILDNEVRPQDEKAINIKLPENLNSLEKLTVVNKRIQDILKLYNIDGQFDFQGFDRGTDWYVVCPVGVLSYHFLIAGLDIAQKYFKVREAYYDSETAKHEYLSALDKEEATEKELNDYTDRKLERLVKNEVNEAINKLGIGTNNENESITKILKATTALIKELDEGVEFHLSLNPPTYAIERGGVISIDYAKIKPLIAKQNTEQKQLPELHEANGETENE